MTKRASCGGLASTLVVELFLRIWSVSSPLPISGKLLYEMSASTPGPAHGSNLDTGGRISLPHFLIPQNTESSLRTSQSSRVLRRCLCQFSTVNVEGSRLAFVSYFPTERLLFLPRITFFLDSGSQPSLNAPWRNLPAIHRILYCIIA